MPMSASQWGSPLASRRALLIHGLAMCSNSWEGVAQRLVTEGFFVLAPNLLGHAWRQCNDYRVSALAEDLHPYFAADMSYDVVIGHSFGGTVALSLLPFLPKTKETTLILVDPPLEVSEEQRQVNERMCEMKTGKANTAEELMAENPTWSWRDCVLRALGVSMFASADIKQIFLHNMSWSYSGLFNSISPHVKVTVLIADPKLSQVCHLEHVPSDVTNLETRVLTGVGHFIPFERPDAILDSIPLPSAKV